MKNKEAVKQLEFQITFTETNLRWLLGETPRRESLIKETKDKIKELKEKLQVL